MEDVISIVDGRTSLNSEWAACSPELRAYVTAEIGRNIANPQFIDQLPGHLPSDPGSQGRLPPLMERLRAISKLA
jgi:hypothetical protein